MKPEDRPEPRKPFDPLTPRNPNLDKIDNRVRGVSKAMRNTEDIMADYIANGESSLDNSELRLIDLKIFEKTGKHIDKFKDPKKPQPKPRVNGNKLKFATKDPLDPTALLDAKTEKNIADRIAARASENVS